MVPQLVHTRSGWLTKLASPRHQCRVHRSRLRGRRRTSSGCPHCLQSWGIGVWYDYETHAWLLQSL